MVRGFATAATFLVSGVAALTEAVTPIENVVNLLKKLEAQVKDEGEDEAKAYDKFACFCRDNASEKHYRIEQAEKKLKAIEIDIEGFQAKIDKLNTDITDHKKKLKDIKKDMEDKEEKRKKENEEYLKTYADVTGAVSAVKKAIAAIKAKAREMENASMDNVAIESYLQSETALLAFRKEPQPHAYKFGSKEILRTLTSLLQKFEKREATVYKEEQTAKFAFDKDMTELRSQKKFTSEALENDEASLAENEEGLENSNADKKETEGIKKTNKEFLDELTKRCEDRAKTHDQRTQSRTQELSALNQAVKILKEPMTTEKGSFVQTNTSESSEASLMETNSDAEESSVTDALEDAEAKADQFLGSYSFLQLAAHTRRTGNYKLVNYLRNAGKKLNSTILLSVAVKASEGKDVFVKVRGLIKDLITRLKEQAKAEATKKAYCDKHMNKALEERNKARAERELQEANHAEEHDRVKKTQATIEDLQQSTADLRNERKKTAKQYQEEYVRNKKSLANAEAGLDALTKALKFLKDYYNKGGFLQLNQAPKKLGETAVESQMRESDVSAVPSKDYKGNQDAAKGIFEILQQIKTDYSDNVKDLKKEMDDNEKENDDYEKKTSDDLKKLGDNTDKANETKTKAEQAKMEAGDKAQDEKDQLATLEEKVKNLEAECVADNSEEAKKAKREKREQEIKSLKDALEILREMAQKSDGGF